MKRQRVVFSKQFLPDNAKRITKADGKRVWLINGVEFESKRAWFQFVQNAEDEIRQAKLKSMMPANAKPLSEEARAALFAELKDQINAAPGEPVEQ